MQAKNVATQSRTPELAAPVAYTILFTSSESFVLRRTVKCAYGDRTTGLMMFFEPLAQCSN